ncbi:MULTISPECIES: DUF7333 family protein [Salinibaculum]|uniref:DUF7333 family protein n=1 Tax=Salinibaculum TaxID=2732368 RepID=UPI0030CEFEB5
MKFDFLRAGGILLLVVVLGIGGLIGSGMMQASTVLMMVAPSMLVFAAIAFALGVKHGEYRAGH